VRKLDSFEKAIAVISFVSVVIVIIQLSTQEEVPFKTSVNVVNMVIQPDNSMILTLKLNQTNNNLKHTSLKGYSYRVFLDGTFFGASKYDTNMKISPLSTASFESANVIDDYSSVAGKLMSIVGAFSVDSKEVPFNTTFFITPARQH